MLRLNGAALDEADESTLCTRKQDDEFCKMLRAVSYMKFLGGAERRGSACSFAR